MREYLLSIKSEIERVEVIKKIDSDKEKSRCLELISSPKLKADIIKSFISDEEKCKYLEILSDDYIKATIITSFHDDNLKANFIRVLKDDLSKINIIRSIKDKQLRINCLVNIKNIKYIRNIIDHAEYLDTIIIPNKLIEKYANYYKVKLSRLNSFISKFGYKILWMIDNDNIKDALRLNKTDFYKYMELFKEINLFLNNNDINNATNSILQREFRLKRHDSYSVYGILEAAISTKNKDNIIKIINEISNYVDIDLFIKPLGLLRQDFLNSILEGKNKNILHDITNKYIMLKRNEYVRERQKHLKKELNLTQKYDKKFIINKVITTTSTNDILILISKCNKDRLSSQALALIKNEKVLREIINFKKEPSRCQNKNAIFPYLKIFNEILTNLYDMDLLKISVKDEECKYVYIIDNVSADTLVSVTSFFNVEKMIENIFNNSTLYNQLLQDLDKYKFIGSLDIYTNIVKSADLDYSSSTVASFISNYDRITKYIKDYNIIPSFTTLMEVAGVYDSSSYKYEILFGRENSKLLDHNPPANSASMSKNLRLENAIYYINIMYKRKYITVPPIDEDISINGKNININLGNFTDMINLTYGERTGSCMRIGGTGATLFDFCLKNDNGFHICLRDKNSMNFISRVSGFRNGNTVFLNQLRNSVLATYDDYDIVSAIKVVADMLIERTKDSKFPIANVIISSDFAMNKYVDLIENLEINDSRDGYDYFYADVENSGIVLASSNNKKLVPIELGPNNCSKYLVNRKKVQEYDAGVQDDFSDKIASIQIIDQLLEDIPFEDCDYIVPNGIVKCYIGEDWYLTKDIDGNIQKYIMSNSNNKELALEEINNILAKNKIRKR